MALCSLVFTDLVDSTLLVERLGDARARTLMREHNRMLRDNLERHDGIEAIHTGDGILASFRSASTAFDCAVGIQHAFRAHNLRCLDLVLRLRIGLHVGAPLPEEGRLFGCCVNATVRVCAVTAAEQILVSDDVRRIAIPLTRGRHGLHDRGFFTLKGLTAPRRLHELVWQ